MKLKRAEILGEKTGRCFACTKTKKVLITREKSTGKEIIVCEDCIREAGEKEIFYSKKMARIMRNPYIITGLRIFFYGLIFLIAFTIIVSILGFLGYEIPKDIKNISAIIVSVYTVISVGTLLVLAYIIEKKEPSKKKIYK